MSSLHAGLGIEVTTFGVLDGTKLGPTEANLEGIVLGIPDGCSVVIPTTEGLSENSLVGNKLGAWDVDPAMG